MCAGRMVNAMDSQKWGPAQLEQELKKSIIGQDGYLKDLSTCIWLHDQRRQHYLRTGEHLRGPKYNMLIIGNSGTGKTSSIMEAARLLEIPVVIEDASELRGSGWKGKQVSEITRDITETTFVYDVTATEPDEYSIVVLDEIDKVVGAMGDKSFSPISNLLKFIEGTEASCGEGSSRVHMRTDNLLFIAAGAFDGLKEVILKRTAPKSIGFSMQEETETQEDVLKNVTPEDLIAYGMNEQFLGRFPLICTLNELNEDTYQKILLQSGSSPIRQLDLLLSRECGVNVAITDEAAHELAVLVKDSSLGARAIQQNVAQLLKDTLYHVHDTEKDTRFTLDYDSGFVVRSTVGERSALPEPEPDEAFVLTDAESKQIKSVELDSIKGNEDAIRIYAEELFEPFETKGFGASGHEGFTDRYDYMTIKMAKCLTAVAVVKVLLSAEQTGQYPDMLSLMETIQGMSLEPKKLVKHPLEYLERRLLHRLEGCKRQKLEEIKKLAWTVIRKYAHKIIELRELAEQDAVYE